MVKVIMKRLSKGSIKVFAITTPQSYFDGVQDPGRLNGYRPGNPDKSDL